MTFADVSLCHICCTQAVTLLGPLVTLAADDAAKVSTTVTLINLLEKKKSGRSEDRILVCHHTHHRKSVRERQSSKVSFILVTKMLLQLVVFPEPLIIIYLLHLHVN